MSEISELIKNYLTSEESDYAIMIDGQWGSGKTYYWKSNLTPMVSMQEFSRKKIQKTEKSNSWFVKDQVKETTEITYYEPIYVSLFGLNNIDELGRRIFVEINPFWKKKTGKVLSNIGKLALNKTINFFGINSIDKGEITSIVNSLDINENKVICLDDLERLSPTLLNELFGFINLFTEHDHLKVIILSDESIIREKFKEYNKIKEKIIRFTYVYHPDIKQVYSEIIDKSKNSEFQKFMETRADFVCNLFLKANHKNIRTLKFNLELFNEIYTKLSKISKNTHYEIVLDRFLYFLSTYCIEYKTEQKRKNLDKLKNISNVNLISFSELGSDFKIASPNKKEEPEPPTYEELFREKYIPYDDVKYAYYECIANYVHSGILDHEPLNSIAEEIVSQLIINDKTKEIDISQKLNNIYILDDLEIITLINKVLKKIEVGEYQLVTYPNIFFSLLRIEHLGINEFKIDKNIIGKFKTGIEKGKQLSKYIHSFDFHIPRFESPNAKYDIVKGLALSANNSLKDAKNIEQSQKIINSFEEGNAEGIFDFITDSDYQFEPIFSFLDPKLFYQKVLDMSNSDKWRVYDALHIRYPYSNASNSSKAEVPFFKELKQLIDNEITRHKVKHISTEILKQMSSLFDQIIKLPD